MSTTVEEVQAKLSMDVSTLGRAKRELAEFNAGGHAGFLHHTNGAREFHKSIHALTEQVPGLGIAFQALMSPIGATMTAATMAFTYAKEKLAEWNAEMDKAAERNAKPVFGHDALLAVGVTQAKMQDEYESFMRRRDDSEKRFRDGLDDEQDKIKETLETEKKRLALKKEGAELIIRTQVENGSMSASAGMMASLALGQTSQHEERGLDQAALADRANALRRGVAQASAQREAAAHELSDINEKRKKAVDTLAQLEAMLPDKEAALEQVRTQSERKQEDEIATGQAESAKSGMFNPSKWGSPELEMNLPGREMTGTTRWGTPEQIKAERDNDINGGGQSKALLNAVHEQEEALKEDKKAIAAAKVELDNLGKAFGDSKEKLTKWDSTMESGNEHLRKVAAEQRQQQNSPLGAVRPGEFSSPNSFSTSELAGYNTRYGGIAREIQRREADSREASAGGHEDLAASIRDHGKTDFRPGIKSVFDVEMQGKGVQDLYNLLPKGFTKEQQAGDRSKAMIDSIVESLSGNSKAVSVKVISMSNGE